ncbi:MAG: hypothetical protein AAFX65_08545 [Cyanobacteria bacterium J06638_7]
MLTSPPPAWSWPAPLAPLLAARLLAAPLVAAALPLALMPSAVAQSSLQERPPGLVVLEERPSFKGTRVLGVYGVQIDPASAGVRRVQLWIQQGSDVSLNTDTLSCSLTAPMRMTRRGERWVVRQLNPGGPVSAANRVDHLVWWAVCHPEQAGRDPASLAPLARELGYSGELRESEQVLPGRSR